MADVSALLGYAGSCSGWATSVVRLVDLAVVVIAVGPAAGRTVYHFEALGGGRGGAQVGEEHGDVQSVGKWAAVVPMLLELRQTASALGAGPVAGRGHRLVQVAPAAMVGVRQAQQRLRFEAGWAGLGGQPCPQ
jgi:hypothetical protein